MILFEKKNYETTSKIRDVGRSLYLRFNSCSCPNIICKTLDHIELKIFAWTQPIIKVEGSQEVK